MKLGRYTVVKKLGVGGMAEVFLATLEGPSGFTKPVVLKRILPARADDSAFVELFMNEARLAARLNHPNIVHVYGFEQLDDELVISMELVDGPSCRALLRKEHSLGLLLPVELASSVVAQACAGLDYAHGLRDPVTGARVGIVHRDISPDNLLVSSGGVVKVCDFGIARSLAATGLTVWTRGKTPYLAPERLDPERTVDHRCDVFSLGVVLFELLTGVRPFEGDDDLQVINAIANVAPPPPSSLRADLPPELDVIVARALEKQPERRFQRCRDLADALVRAGVVRDLGRDPQLLSIIERSATPDHLRRTLDTSEPELPAPPPPRRPPVSRKRTSRPSPPRRLPVAPALALATAVCLLAASAVVFVVHVRRTSRAQHRPAATASIELRSTPPADVWLGAQRLGRTPCVVRGLSPGSLRFVLSDTETAFRRELPVELRSGDNGVREVSGEKASLEVRVFPFAYVKLDRRDLGATPLGAVELWQGEHQLELYDAGATLIASHRIELKAGEKRVLKVRAE